MTREPERQREGCRVALLSRVLLSGLAVAVVAAALVKPRRKPRDRAHAPEMVDDALIVADRSRLPLACWTPEGRTRALVLGLHGYGDYRRAFRLAGPWLAARDVAFYAYDQRGFGETETRGQWPGAHELIHDLADAVGALRQHHPDLPLVLMGESMGGAVALAALAEGAITTEGLILAAPGVRGDVPLRQVHDVALRLAALALPWLAVELRRGAQPWLEPSEAARLAASQPGTAAIAGDMAADQYDLEKLQECIEDTSDNTTRFLVIGREEIPASGNDKTTLLVSTSDTGGGAGVLHSLLKPLADHGVVMTFIESRPSRRKNWDYVFFIDIEGHANEPPVAEALAILEKKSSLFRVLGAYPKAVN